ncbi:hypothetical protein BgAZ_401730 [Babesia gibsoni]|uniref:Uncharacterized protein n=1 Tax=Babesia gibsoni TaxID=33632 RepID=A0AAD8PCJ6_BABGI|nr:hypothetical protein BgAZ_401730 [Babesia gibsoni]
MNKPSFNLSELGASKSLSACKEFLPRMEISNAELASEISKGDRSKVVDCNIQFYTGNNCPEDSTAEADESDMFLDVGVGVFDVGSGSVDEQVMNQHGITTVTVDENSKIFAKAEPLITEVVTHTNRPS